MLRLLFALVAFQDSPEALQSRVQDALSSGERARVEALFAQKEDAAYLFAMAGQSGVSTLKAFVFPAPPGWEKTGSHWVTFHRFQEIQQHHDPIYAVASGSAGLLGRELPEWDTDHRTKTAVMDVRLHPAESKATIDVKLELDSRGDRAPVFRLNQGYTVLGPGGPDKIVTPRGEALVAPKDGDIVRIGGLLIPWSRKTTALNLKYQAVLKRPDHDKITDRVAYLTAFWVPDLARLPYTTRVRITGPAGWVLRSEGDLIKEDDAAFGSRAKPDLGEKVVAYKCDLPISFPKVMAGAYKIAAERTVGRHTFRSFMLEPIDKPRADKIVQNMVDGVEFFEKTLGPFPFNGYECYDGLGYYGIESYSHTLLEPRISLWAVTHEIGHTYFGGMAPCAYVRDTWNEGVTMYVDDVLFKKNMEVLENGLQTMSISKPLSKMGVAWENGSATYYRGAYVMRMLEHEIGWDAMAKGLQALVQERRGMETTWADLRPIFERTSGKDLAWFWKQWIDGATYPSLEVVKATAGSAGTVRVVVRQSGTAAPYRMKFRIALNGGAANQDAVVTMDRREQSFEIRANGVKDVAISPMELTMAKGGAAKPVE